MKNNVIRFRTIHPTNNEKAIRYVEYDRIEKTGRAYYSDPVTGQNTESAADSLYIGSEWDFGQRLAQWIEQGDTITPGWE